MPFVARYNAHEALVRPARPRAELWRMFLALGIIYVVGLSLLSLILPYVVGQSFGPSWEEVENGATPSGMLILLGSYSFFVVGVAVAAGVLQRRGLETVLGRWSVFWRQFLCSSLFLLVLAMALVCLPPYGLDDPLREGMSFWRWFSLLPLSLLAVLIQSGSEEIVFRGYLQQALAARFHARLIWIGIPSLLFAIGHYAPADAGENSVPIVIWAFVFGVCAADLTARAGTLAPAIALHFFNNVASLVIFASPSGLNGLALYLLPYEMSDATSLRPWIAVEFVTVVVGWLTVRLALRR